MCRGANVITLLPPCLLSFRYPMHGKSDMWLRNTDMVCFYRTALMYASLLGLSITVEMLLKRGANPQLTDSNDHTGMKQYQCI